MRPTGGVHVNSESRHNSRGGGVPESEDVLTRPTRSPDAVLRYGDGADHVADVYLPSRDVRPGAASGGNGSFLLFFHGGFWRAQYDRAHTGPLAQALAAAALVVCTAEYRRPGGLVARGGGWPGT